MITLDFLIKPELVLYHALRAYYPGDALPHQPTEALDQMLHAAEKIDSEILTLIRADMQSDMIGLFVINAGISLQAVGKRVDELIHRLFADDILRQKLLDETSVALAAVRKEWESNYFKSNEYLAQWTGEDLSRSFKVFMTHPACKQGFNDMRGNIFWTYRLDFPNYNTVYLWHEIMHYYVGRTGNYPEKVIHSVVELLTDVELRVKLNHCDYLPLVGHEHLRQCEKALLPVWHQYIESPDKKDIGQFIARVDKFLREKKLL